jgi:hypothetical protein
LKFKIDDGNTIFKIIQLSLKHFNNDADAKAFVDELEIVPEEKSISNEKKVFK